MTGTLLDRLHEAQWNKSQKGIGCITAHRDPPSASGVIAIVTVWGSGALPRMGGPQPTEWFTGDGDLVMLRGTGWPTEDYVCPTHEAESPVQGDRMIMTLRYNERGPDADYF